MAAAAIIAAKKVRAEALAREARMTDEDIIKMIEDRKREEEEDKIVHRQPAQDPNNFTGCGKTWIEKVANPMQNLTEMDKFNNFIIVIIMLAGIVVGFQTDRYCEKQLVIKVCETIIMIIFIFEVVAKILAEGSRPLRYWLGPEWKWNNFDFFIVVLSLVPTGESGGAVKLLRLVRLARLAKLIKKIPALQMIIMGLVGGMVQIVNIMLLLTIVLYLFGIVGNMLFGENDPWHFGTLSRSLMSLFRASTLEDWTDIKYISYFGCDSPYYDSGIYWLDDPNQNPAIQRSGLYWADGCPVTCHSRYDPQLTREIWRWNGTHAVSRGERIVYKNNDWTLGVYGYRTGVDDPVGSPGRVGFLGMGYWIAFILISALVMLSLFIGAVTMAMTESMEEMKTEQSNDKMIKAYLKREAQKKKREKKKEEARLKRENQRASEGKARRLTSRSFKREASEIERELKEEQSLEEKEAKNLLQNAWNESAMDKLIDYKGEDAKKKGCLCYKYYELSRLAKYIAHDTDGFTHFITGVIILAGFMVGIGMETNAKNPHILGNSCRPGCTYPAETLRKTNTTLPMPGATYLDYKSQNTLRSSEDIDCVLEHEVYLDCHADCIERAPFIKFTDGLEILILIIFTAEVVIKVVAEFDKPFRYFYNNGIDGWNNFDFVIVVGSLLPTEGGGGMLVILRLLRLLRVLKLLKAFPKLQVIVKALISGLSSISYIAMILMLFFFMMGILFQIVFLPNDPWHFGTLPNAIYSLFRASTLEDWTDIMYTNMYGCANYGHFPMCEDIGFDNVVLNTTGPLGSCYDRFNDPDDTRIMHEMYCCCRELTDEIYGDPDKAIENEWFGAVFFLFFTVIGALVLMTLFIGVITTAMEEAQSEQKKEKEKEEAEKSVIDEYKKVMAGGTIDKYKQVFDIIDEDKSGAIDEDEMRRALHYIGQDEQSLDEIYKLIGNEDKNELSFPQFLGMMSQLKQRESEGLLKGVSDGNDDNNDVGDEVVDSKNPVVEGRSSPDDEKSIEMTSITIENPMNSNSVVTLDTDDVSAKQIG